MLLNSYTWCCPLAFPVYIRPLEEGLAIACISIFNISSSARSHAGSIEDHPDHLSNTCFFFQARMSQFDVFILIILSISFIFNGIYISIYLDIVSVHLTNFILPPIGFWTLNYLISTIPCLLEDMFWPSSNIVHFILFCLFDFRSFEMIDAGPLCFIIHCTLNSLPCKLVWIIG